MKKNFLDDIRKIQDESRRAEKSALTENDIAHLPNQLKKYLNHCGYLHKDKIINGQIYWSTAYHKRNQKSNWSKLNYFQFNSVHDISRFVYIDAGIVKLIEKYQNGYGTWKMVLLKFLKLIDVKNIKEINESALVTLLSEFPFFPTLFLSDGLKFNSIDDNTLEATINHNKNIVRGVFFFSESGELLRFETTDRYYSENGKDFNRVKWIGTCENYIERNGIKIPSKFTAKWQFEKGEFEYFQGQIEEIKYNI